MHRNTESDTFWFSRGFWLSEAASFLLLSAYMHPPHTPVCSLETSIILRLGEVDPSLSPLKVKLGNCFKISHSTSILLS